MNDQIPALLSVGCGPGRSGGDAVRGLMCEHPDVVPLAARPVLILDATARLLAHVEDGPGFLPRGAAVAFREFITVMERRLGDAAREPLARLCDAVVVDCVDIADYGRLPLVHPLSRRAWLAHLGQFVDAVAAGLRPAPTSAFVADGIAHDMLLASLLPGLSSRARSVVVLRHPAVAAASLSESQVVARPLGESIQLVRMHHQRWIDGPRSGTEVIVRFEDLLDAPRPTLTGLAAQLGLAAERHWAASAASTVGRWDVARHFDQNLALAAHRELEDLAADLGYGESPC